ncbi:Succinate dehydrogenase flavoprotein subunit [hydrothermal vent metagenome]|uniref:Succinate dehydrogenase flavoprotein subunit n=1 Tax=hydrothermal vent metagenome TaxID=652676 RepID=A0A3B1DSV6_9ZZZZ
MKILDILIVGGGGAGLSAAIEAKKIGADIAVLSKTNITTSQTCQAQGGINASLNDNQNNINNHINDTLKSAHNIGDKKTIITMCRSAKDTIEWLDNLGVPFSRDKNNNIAQRKLGGTKDHIACYSSDYTGLKILHTLFDTCLKQKVTFLEEYMLLNIIIENNIAIGAVVLDLKTTKIIQLLAKRIIFATGGYAGVYTNFNTNSYATTGDGIAVALRRSVKTSHMEYVQFHPTALKERSILISESARGEGGYLVTKDGKRFVDELKSRDEVAREIYLKIQRGKDVFLDTRHLGYDKIILLMPQEYKLILKYTGLKMEKDLIPISPAAHYSMGGILTDKYGQTSTKNLYAVGECANNGVHGANRLGGNSLLEIIVFGRIAGKHATQHLDGVKINMKEYDTYTKEEKRIKSIFKLPNIINFYDTKRLLGELLYKNVGLFRTKKNLEDTIVQLEKWQNDINNMGIGDKQMTYNTNLKDFIEFTNMLEIAIAITKSALARKESRGAHYRIDYPEELKC